MWSFVILLRASKMCLYVQDTEFSFCYNIMFYDVNHLQNNLLNRIPWKNNTNKLPLPLRDYYKQKKYQKLPLTSQVFLYAALQGVF